MIGYNTSYWRHCFKTCSYASVKCHSVVLLPLTVDADINHSHFTDVLIFIVNAGLGVAWVARAKSPCSVDHHGHRRRHPHHNSGVLWRQKSARGHLNTVVGRRSPGRRRTWTYRRWHTKTGRGTRTCLGDLTATRTTLTATHRDTKLTLLVRLSIAGALQYIILFYLQEVAQN